MSAAVELFAERGVAATTFAMIAERSALTPAMLHYYFEDRQRLLDAVVEERMAPVIRSVWEPVTPGTPTAVLIRGIVQRFLDGIERMPWIPALWIRDVLNEGGMLRTRVVRHVPFEKVRVVITAIQEQQRRRELNPNVDAILIIFSLLGLVMVHCATVRLWAELFHQRLPAKAKLQRHITSLLLDGLRKAERRERRQT